MNANSETKISSLNDSLKLVEDVKKAAQARAEELKKDLDKAQAMLKKQRPEKNVIVSYKMSNAYSKELAATDAAKIHYAGLWLKSTSKQI